MSVPSPTEILGSGTVTTAGGTSAESAADRFTYVAAAASARARCHRAFLDVPAGC